MYTKTKYQCAECGNIVEEPAKRCPICKSKWWKLINEENSNDNSASKSNVPDKRI